MRSFGAGFAGCSRSGCGVASCLQRFAWRRRRGVSNEGTYEITELVPPSLKPGLLRRRRDTGTVTEDGPNWRCSMRCKSETTPQAPAAL